MDRRMEVLERNVSTYDKHRILSMMEVSINELVPPGMDSTSLTETEREDLWRQEYYRRLEAFYSSTIPPTEAKPQEIDIMGTPTLYYPFVNPQLETLGGGKPIGLDEYGEQIIQYDGKSMARTISEMFKDYNQARQADPQATSGTVPTQT